MTTYLVGDVQGCLEPLKALLAAIDFEPSRDRLWFAGDLVNRGPASLGVLRFVRDLGPCALTVLGNHDLHLLARASGAARARRGDTLDDVLSAPDSEGLLAWLARRPLIHRDAGVTLVHAGLLPAWTLAQAEAETTQVARAIARGGSGFFAGLYGNEPRVWDEGLSGMERTRLVVNACTRMRYLTTDGALDCAHHGPVSEAPPDLVPWFTEAPAHQGRVAFGHWSALGSGPRGVHIALDGGCVWGRHLAAYALETGRWTRVDCPPPPLSRASGDS